MKNNNNNVSNTRPKFLRHWTAVLSNYSRCLFRIHYLTVEAPCSSLVATISTLFHHQPVSRIHYHYLSRRQKQTNKQTNKNKTKQNKKEKKKRERKTQEQKQKNKKQRNKTKKQNKKKMDPSQRRGTRLSLRQPISTSLIWIAVLNALICFWQNKQEQKEKRKTQYKETKTNKHTHTHTHTPTHTPTHTHTHTHKQTNKQTKNISKKKINKQTNKQTNHVLCQDALGATYRLEKLTTE